MQRTKSEMPKLTRRQLEKLLSDWNTIARSTLDCETCDRFYETPFEWLDKKERAEFVNHLYESHVRTGRKLDVDNNRHLVRASTRS